MKKNKKIVLLMMGLLLIFSTMAAPMSVLRTHATEVVSPYKAPYNKAYLIIKEFSITEGSITPGKPFELNVTFKNSSNQNNMGSTVITFTSADGMIHPSAGRSNQIYIDSMYVEQEISITIPMEADPALNTTTTSLLLESVYADQETYSNMNNNIEIFLPVSTESVLNIKNFSVPGSATVGTKARINVNYENLGTANLSNIKMYVQGGAYTEPLEISLDSLSGGSMNYAESYVQFLETGSQAVDIHFTYEDGSGTTYETPIQTFVVSVEEPDTTSDIQQGAGYASDGGNTNVVKIVIQIVILLVIAIILMVIVKIWKKNR